MPITINGAGTVTGITAGGLPDGIITAPDLSGAQTGSAPIYGCRAWVNFDGTRNEADTGASTNGANVKILASGNVTSVLKNAVGDYTVNFTTALADANFSAVASSTRTSTTLQTGPFASGFTSSTARFILTDVTSAANRYDEANINVTIFR